MGEEARATDQSRTSPQPGVEGSRRPNRSTPGQHEEEDEGGFAGDKNAGDPSGNLPVAGTNEIGPGALATASPAVPGHFNFAQISELEQQIDLLKQENVALKERCKEIRLNLQRKITELQDTLTISR